jgi:hypothetical protein
LDPDTEADADPDAGTELKKLCGSYHAKKCGQYCGAGSVWIRIIFLGTDLFLSFSGSVSYSNEHTYINLKEKFNNIRYACWLGPGGPTDKENQVKMYFKKSTVLGTLPL